ncbi:hypothetical protein MHM88_15185 [Epibacterium sp. MM17-32]|uniref:hypothetical protein n=1 Tax=Epibacterium sp. MM17-32 TaxID=2917734 RepID=UPI001EF3F735|nr:hypothetical protein [Epibacterium sp. MM17-32]MCG7629153.1 hypothetical protein [Epibacterium sp. MM17-32]
MTEPPANKDAPDIFAYLSVSAAKSKSSESLSAADRTTLVVKRLRDEEAKANAEKTARLRAFRKKTDPR